MSRSIREQMAQGESVFGTWCMLPSSTTVDVLARTGIDFVVIDLEHGAIGWQTAEDMVRAAQVHGCQPIIRVGDAQSNTILHALETGCEAVLVPHVSSAGAARAVVSAARYAPLGERGLSPYTRCHGYRHQGLAESMERHARETLVGVLVEGTEGIGNLPEIVAVDGVDLVYLGMYDISQSVGRPGELEHPDVLAQLDRCLADILAGGRFAGTFTRDVEDARRLRSMGFHFVAFVADSYGLTEYFTAAAERFGADR